MIRIAIVSALLLGAGAIADRPATSIVGRALASPPQSRAQAAAVIDDATAAALVGAISSQFGDRSVQVQLGQVHVDPAGIIQRDIHGAGLLQVGSDSVWIPFRFRALYDTEQASVGSPELTLGAGEPSRVDPRNGAVAQALGREVGRRLHQEFAEQATHFRLEDLRSAPAGATYLRVEARGFTTFGQDGRAATRIHALYDPRRDEWLQLTYELGAGGAPSRATVAVR